MTANSRQDGNVVSLPRWGTPAEAADAHGISARTLRLWAKQGKVERQGSGRSTRYRLPDTDPGGNPSGNAAGMPLAALPPLPAAVAANDSVVLSLVDRLTDAERRAAIAETRAELSDTDPDEVARLREMVAELEPLTGLVEELRTELERTARMHVTALEEANAEADRLRTRHAIAARERDEARDQARALADAMRKRHGLIKRLTARLANA